MSKGPIDINIKNKKEIKARLFLLKRFQRNPLLHPHTATTRLYCMFYFDFSFAPWTTNLVLAF